MASSICMSDKASSIITWCSLWLGAGWAETAAQEAEHSDEGGNPETESNVEVISHRPQVAVTHRLSDRASTDGIVLGEEEGTSGNSGGELEQADSEGHVDWADSPFVPPGTNEHEDGVESDKPVDCSHESGNRGQLRAVRLAVDVTILTKGN